MATKISLGDVFTQRGVAECSERHSANCFNRDSDGRWKGLQIREVPQLVQNPH